MLKARLKGSLKEERLGQKWAPREFGFFAYFCVCVDISMHTPLLLSNFHASRLALVFDDALGPRHTGITSD